MTIPRRSLLCSMVLAASLALCATAAQAKQLTLCWAAWDPANALVELSKDFTRQTGIEMKYEFVPWTSYADRFLNELNSHSKLCDLIIGDSQWIGGAAENGHYVKLNDFFDKNGLKMSDFVEATVLGYSEWPKHTPNYWALPAMGDAVGWTYRKDWFARPELQKEFQAKYSRPLSPPKTWDEFLQVARFFQNRLIDGKRPQAATGIAATAVFCLIFSWNEYAFAVLLTSGTAQTMPPFIPFIIGEGGQDWPAVAGATTLFVVPILCFTILLRRHLLRGITFGAVRK